MSPCDNCTRVTDPEVCDDKHCPDWQADFTARWEQTRQAVRQLLSKQEEANDS